MTEEDGTPVEGAEVTVWYAGYTPDQTKQRKGETDEGGEFEARGSAKLRIEIWIDKAGYYSSKAYRLSSKQDHDLTFEIRKIRHPIPLYAKKLEVVPPAKDRAIGYDLEVGDWVAPFGQGRQADLLFELNHSKADFWSFEYKLSVTFANEHDGIMQFACKKYSDLMSPYLAPEDGYVSKWVQTAVRNGKDEKVIRNTAVDRGHWMRVRTKTDENGEIISANYVKVYGDFPQIRYFFNPAPNDRNLEFDPQKNLFKTLEPEELVTEP